MEHAGEGHFDIYFKHDQTGLGSMISGMYGRLDTNTAQICAYITNAFKRYEKDVSSPSDPSSLVFGIYHSPVSDTYIRSNINITSRKKFKLTTVAGDEWAIPKAILQLQKDPRNPAVFQSAIFTELIGAIVELGEPPANGQNDPIAIHLETDVFTYRAIVMSAEKARLRFRFFPTPAHHQFDKHRAECERKEPLKLEERKENRFGNEPAHVIEGIVGELSVTSTSSMRYHIVAYCAGCAKQLAPEKRLQCSQCKIAFYCSAECQKKDWKNLHKNECKKFSKLIAEADCEYCKKA